MKIGSISGLVYASSDLDNAHGTVQANGFTPLDEPHKDKAGRRVFTVTDPDGNRLAFFTK
jgi:predicted enzyme related to lactoylglutathione lyase